GPVHRARALAVASADRDAILAVAAVVALVPAVLVAAAPLVAVLVPAVPVTASARVAAPAAAGRVGQVERRVAVEEAVGLEPEARVVDRHDRPVLRARDVREAEGVPHDEVAAVDVAARGDRLGEARTARV